MTTVWLIVPALMVGVIAWTNTDFPVDFWMHANLGRFMWQHGHCIQVDTFTYTIAGQPVTNQAWLAQLLLYWAASAGGYALVQFAAGAIYAASFTLLVALTYHRCGDARVTAALALVTMGAMMSNIAVRPQVFSVLLFSALLTVLWTWAPGRSRLWSIAAIQLAWVNLHGAFPVGIVLIGIFVLGRAVEIGWTDGRAAIVHDRQLRSLAIALAVALLVTLLNPNGIHVIDYVLGVSARATQRHIVEWLPPTTSTAAGMALFGLIGLSFVVVGTSRKPIRFTELLVFIALLGLASRAQRMVIWWALALPPILAPHAVALTSALFSRRKTAPVERSFSNTLVLGLLVLFSLFATPWTRPYNPLLPAAKRCRAPRDIPTNALHFLQQEHYRGRLFQPMEWGSLASWTLAPKTQVFVDSRIDFFPDRVWNDYVTITTRPALAPAVLEHYAVDTVIWDRRRATGLVEVLEHSPKWHRVYQDDLAVIYQGNESKSSISASGSGATEIE